MTRGLKVADGLLFERRLICDERGGQALRGGGTGGYEGPGRKGMRFGGHPNGLSATRAGWFTGDEKIVAMGDRPPKEPV
jgi:hypothetical protein